LTAAGDGHNGVYLPYIKYVAANATYGKSNQTYLLTAFDKICILNSFFSHSW
jgi:hypothetical protein